MERKKEEEARFSRRVEREVGQKMKVFGEVLKDSICKDLEGVTGEWKGAEKERDDMVRKLQETAEEIRVKWKEAEKERNDVVRKFQDTEKKISELKTDIKTAFRKEMEEV